VEATQEEFKDAGLGRWIWWAHQKLEAMQNRSHDRGPEDFESRYTQEEVRFLISAALKERGSQYGGVHGSGDGFNKNSWLITLNIALVVGGGGWLISKVVDDGARLSRIECQLNPSTCLQLQLVPHGP